MKKAKHRIVLAARWEAWRRKLEAEHRRMGMSAGEAKAEADRAWARVKARLDWLEAQFKALLRLDRALGRYWGRFADAHPEIDFEDPACPALPDPPEQAERDRVQAAIDAVRERDVWPRHLHWGDV